MTRLADPARSKAILVGTARYEDPTLGDIPAVAANVTDLAAVLTDPELGGLRPENVQTILDPTYGINPGLAIASGCQDVQDVLLVYFTGHGLVGDGRELLLALSDTKVDLKDHSSLPVSQVRTAIANSPARARILILDCCYSGRGIDRAMSGGDSPPLLEAVNVEGVYALASASRDRESLFVPGERHTMFTGELITLLREGVADHSPLLALSTMYHQLVGRLRGRKAPTPRVLHTDTVSGLALVRNKGYQPEESAESVPEQASAPVPLRTPAEADEFANRVSADLKAARRPPYAVPLGQRANALDDLTAAATDPQWPVLARLRFACMLVDAGAKDRATAAIYALGGGYNEDVVRDIQLLRDALDDDHTWSRLHMDDWTLDGLIPRHQQVADFDPTELWGTVMAMLLAVAGLPTSVRLQAITELAQLGHRDQARRIAQGMLRARRSDPDLAAAAQQFVG